MILLWCILFEYYVDLLKKKLFEGNLHPNISAASLTPRKIFVVAFIIRNFTLASIFHKLNRFNTFPFDGKVVAVIYRCTEGDKVRDMTFISGIENIELYDRIIPAFLKIISLN